MNKQKLQYFANILKHYRRQEAKDKLKHIGVSFVILNSAYLFLCLFLESIWYLSPGVKEILWYLLSLNTFFIFRVISILILSISNHSKNEDEFLLLHIGQQFPDINDKLLNHFQ
ncbi:MAG: hypothetical protein KAU44_07495, partial [Candidatus Marinimicrobia bacterium]|nr:hypothetical protein [Candidatus Neomarinimicrobiota bacterium]